MNTMKTLMLAGFAAVTIGAGVANAQSLTPSAGEGAYYQNQGKTAPAQFNRGANAGQSGAVQFGSSEAAAPAPIDSDTVGGGF
jgi:hypothetical protein